MAEAAAPERQMKRSLSALDLTALGIGAIIGAGIFALTGTAAAGQVFSSKLETPVLNFIQAWLSGGDVVLGRNGAGPAIMISFMVAGLACGFAALCYAELASMIPVSGSAYTYSYATLGEIIAWIIGWDLILEYAVGNMSVAVGWSGYFVALCGSTIGLKFPIWLVNDHRTATDLLAKGGDAVAGFSSTTLPVIAGHSIAINLPALLIVAAVTVLLIYGIRESARANTMIVVIKLAVVVFFIAFGAFMVNPTNWHPFVPNGFAGVMSGAAIVFFAFIGFDAVSTTAEGGASSRQRGRACGNDLGAACFPGRSAAHFHGHGARRIAAGILRPHSSALSHAAHHYYLDRRCRRRRCHGSRHRLACRSHKHRNALCIHSRLLWSECAAPHRPGASPAISGAIRSGLPDSRHHSLHCLDAELAGLDLDPFLRLARNRARDLFLLRCVEQQTPPWYRRRLDGRSAAADHQDVRSIKCPYFLSEIRCDIARRSGAGRTAVLSRAEREAIEETRSDTAY